MYFVAWKSQAKTSRGIRLCSSEKSGTGLGLGQRSDGGCRGLQLLLGVAGKRHKPFPAEDDHMDRKCGGKEWGAHGLVRHKPFPTEDDHVDRKCGAGGGEEE